MSNNEVKPISVWMIQHVFPPLWAGPAERFLRYRPGLKNRGVELDFVTSMLENVPRREQMNGSEVYRIGPTIKGVPTYKRFTIRAFLFAIKKRPDILLLFGLHPIHLPFTWLVRIIGIKIIFINTMARTRVNQTVSFKAKLSDYLYLLIINSVNALVFSTDTLAEHIQALGFNKKEKVNIIPNGVDIKRFRPRTNKERDSFRNELNLPEEDLIFLYVGLRVPRKGVSELLKGWKAYKKEGGKGHLLLVGGEQNELASLAEFYKEWGEMVSELKESENVIIRPPTKEIQKYFKASDVFVFLSKHEGMPNVILEAMGCGLPVLTTKFEGFSAAFGRDRQELIITTHETEKIKSDLQVLSDTKMVSKLGINARNWIVENQDLEIILDKYVDLFKRVLI